MAVTTLTYTASAGVNYNIVTDNSIDWASVPINTFFYDKLEKRALYKDGNGTVTRVGQTPTISTVSYEVGLNAKTLGNTTIFTQDTAFVPIDIRVLYTNINLTGATVAPVISVGFTSPTYTEWVNAFALPTTTVVTNNFSDNLIRLPNVARLYSIAQPSIICRVSTATNATTYNIAVVVTGTYIV
jgi:hypothetical protein